MKKLLISVIAFAFIFSFESVISPTASAQFVLPQDSCSSPSIGITSISAPRKTSDLITQVDVTINTTGLQEIDPSSGDRAEYAVLGFIGERLWTAPDPEGKHIFQKNGNSATVILSFLNQLKNGDKLTVNFTNRTGTDQGVICQKTFTVGGGSAITPTPDPGPGGTGGKCTLQISQTPSVIFVRPGTDLIYPKKEVYLKITGPSEDPDIRKGVRVLDTSLNRHFDSCVPLNDLLKGVTVKNGFGTWYEGNRYEAYVTESCGFFNEPQGSPECRDAFIIGDKNEKILKEGDACNPEDNRCDAFAEFCVKTAYDSNKGVCAIAEKPVEPCKNGICKTALGNFRYSPAGFAKSMLTLLLSLSGGILLVFTIINGYKLMVSQGDPEKIKEAREGITGAIAGLLLIIFSIAILQLITVDILGLPGFSR